MSHTLRLDTAIERGVSLLRPRESHLAEVVADELYRTGVVTSTPPDGIEDPGDSAHELNPQRLSVDEYTMGRRRQGVFTESEGDQDDASERFQGEDVDIPMDISEFLRMSKRMSMPPRVSDPPTYRLGLNSSTDTTSSSKGKIPTYKPTGSPDRLDQGVQRPVTPHKQLERNDSPSPLRTVTKRDMLNMLKEITGSPVKRRGTSSSHASMPEYSLSLRRVCERGLSD